MATGLRTFTTGRETKRKNEKDVGFTLVQSTNTKIMYYINLWKRWKHDTNCKQALYCTWWLQYCKYIMGVCLCGQENFPRINTESRRSPEENPLMRKWMLHLWTSWTEIGKASSWAPCEVSFCQATAESPAKPPAHFPGLWAGVGQTSNGKHGSAPKRQPRFVQIKTWVF